MSPNFFLNALCLAIAGDDIESKNIIKGVLETYDELAMARNGTTEIDALIDLYCNIMRKIINDELSLDNKLEVEKTLAEFETHKSVVSNPNIIERIANLINNRKSITDEQLDRMKQDIRKWVIWNQGNKGIRKIYGLSQKVQTTLDPILQDRILNELLDNARKLTETYESKMSVDSGKVDEIDTTNKHSIIRALKSYRKKRVKNGYRLGLQGVSQLFGKALGPVEGEFIAFAALSHHYKSGIMMDMARWIPTYNQPINKSDKIPCVVFISLENEIYENMMMWYNSIYYSIHNSPPGNDVSDEEIVNTVMQSFAKHGFVLKVYRMEGEAFGFDEWKKLHDDLSKKYDVVASILDYAELMKLDSTKSKDRERGWNEAKRLQNLYYKLKTYANRNRIMVVTGIQLDTEAKRLSASGQTNIVSRLRDVHLASCRAAKSELDVLIFMYIETNHLGDKYLTFRRDKHKYVHDTPDEWKQVAYKFTEFGIPDDINGPPRYVRDIYAVDDDIQEDSAVSTSVAF